MPDSLSFNPATGFPAWLTLDYEVLCNNLFSCQRPVIDLSLPLLSRIRHELEAPLQHAGNKFVAAANPSVLAAINPDFTRILLPGANQGDIGCANSGIVPVLSDYASILALSNQAQNDDQRYSFLYQIRTLDDRFSDDFSGFKSVLAHLPGLSMVDLAGVLIDCELDESSITMLQRQLSAFTSEPLLISYNQPGTMRLFSWEILGLSDRIISTAFTAGFWAYPFAVERKEILFRVDLGRAQGLPEVFPALINGIEARPVRVDLNFSVLAIPDQSRHLPARCCGCFVGGSISEPLSPHAWERLALKNYLQHCNQLPIYLTKDGNVEEILPLTAF